MAEPTGATTDAKTGRRVYLSPVSGRRLPSVTTILGAKAKPNLVPWAAKKAATRAVDEYELLYEMRTGKVLNPATGKKWTKAESIDYFKQTHTEVVEAAGIRGTKLHDIAEMDIGGKDVAYLLTPEQRPLYNGYQMFLSDHNPEFISTEITFYNETVGYAGTADFVYTSWSTFGVPVIGDWKTSGTGPWPEWALQLAAYTRGEGTLYKEGALVKSGEMPEVSQERATIVRILPNKYEVWDTDVDLEAAFRIFKSLKNVYEFNKLKTSQVFKRG